ncbi:MAG TPA: DUF2383 domain-containing protein [Chitinophagales bacterium]|nr:DUF2383 domain-containing protein [Chitinophagales bacterium]
MKQKQAKRNAAVNPEAEKIAVLKIVSKLIHANSHRSEVYRTCFNKSASTELRSVFNRNYASGISNTTALTTEVIHLGFDGPVKETGREFFLKVLMEFRAAVAGNGVKALLNTCYEAEEHAWHTYYQAMQSKILFKHPSLLEKLSVQLEEIAETKEAIANMMLEMMGERMKSPSRG